MNLKFYDNPKLAKDEILIGKNHDLRFKKPAVELFGIEEGQRWLVAVDSDEPETKHIFLIKAEDNSNGFKVRNANRSLLISFKGVIQELNIRVPARCRYEAFTQGEYSGIKLILKDEPK